MQCGFDSRPGYKNKKCKLTISLHFLFPALLSIIPAERRFPFLNNQISLFNKAGYLFTAAFLQLILDFITRKTFTN